MTDSAKDQNENDQIKQQFREALERKNHKNANPTAATAGDSKIHHTHGPADHKREFRRKSG
ncbi:hypothetical protein ABIC28_000800 [Rhodococcus sp. PvR044]|uniref:DUF5302 domain-containing protein n=1 Tax=Rhodococcus oryzae TaxID=2571143 RepID=A0ABY2RQE7_9NOCA|nr:MULTISPECIES: DUF5302 domain-containing protein [Rhodococcus]AQA25873.1 hypothetical protein BTZ20_2105 [Rhodococcus sp. MTM3W5.2]MBP1157992.1 hypothetical protein [Rhodococcus sp. PvR099]MCZ4554399.1 DUF5302 domain-containing protein [Rhodococcus maanshanensis]PTR37771.1 hypothetical protein C8K38_11919 [Rhodococcus sp. OK611]TJZ81287.1 hypothetical protein FCG67_01130 [Rhodococcus oryzae]